MINYKIFGSETVDIVIEMGLGACIAEWEVLAGKLGENHGVLVYERAGINHSDRSDEERTPSNIAKELKNLLDQIPHDEKLLIIGHSQGGLYASELKRAGADKSKNFTVLETMVKLGLKGLVKKVMRKAPPFCYADFSGEEKEDILNSLVNISHLHTCREEYRLAHDEAVLKNMVSKDKYPYIPIILITHSSKAVIEEIMEFGRTSRPFAVKIEELWQEIMKDYLGYSKRSLWIHAKKSSHYIHLTEPEIIVESVNRIRHM